MLGALSRYTNWLHTRWPAGTVEKLPDVGADGSTAVPGLSVVGDLTGVPLLKFSSDTGARAVQTMLADESFRRRATADDDVLDVVIVGAGVSGVAAAAEAQKAGLRCAVFEAAEPFSTIENFPAGKPIYTYPSGMTPAGDLQFSPEADVKETLVAELRAFLAERGITPRTERVERVRRTGGRLEVVLSGGEAVAAQRVIVAIGRSGNYRTLGVPGETLDKVTNRLHDPRDHAGRDVLVVGGGDTALETAVAIAGAGGA